MQIQNMQYHAVLSREKFGYYILNQDIFSFFPPYPQLDSLEIEYSSVTPTTGIWYISVVTTDNSTIWNLLFKPACLLRPFPSFQQVNLNKIREK